MDQGDGRFIVLVLEVQVEIPQLPHQEHTLIDNGPAGEGGHIGIFVALLKLPADQVEALVELQPPGHPGGTADEALGDIGHTVQGLLAENLRPGGHIPPAQELHALLAGDDLQPLLGLPPGQGLPGEEEHAHAVVPGPAQVDPHGRGGLGEKRMGNLE